MLKKNAILILFSLCLNGFTFAYGAGDERISVRAESRGNHIHLEFDGKVWRSELNLPRNGIGFIWAQGQLLVGTEFSSNSSTDCHSL